MLIGGIYFTSQWVLGAQPLAMKTWRLRLLSRDGRRLSLRQGLARYVASAFAVPLFGVAYMWALVDPERQFLHDRLAGTRIVVTNRKADG